MSNYAYHSVEPDVVSEKMLMEAVVEQGPVDEAARVAKQEGYDFKDVTSLRLDFKNIARLDGLWEFVNLTKLQLDNNIIEKIENIDFLVNLVCLDLSFNNIEKIEGLHSLKKLEDLSLYNNTISSVENMDTLVNLQILSLGNNDLKDLDNLLYLRRFKHLRSLNLTNNPFCKQKNYMIFVAGILPRLTFLDYRILPDQARQEGYERFQMMIDTITHEDDILDTKNKEAVQDQANYEYYKKAFVENMDGSQLFAKLYENDPEGHLLNMMPDIGDAVDVFKDKFTKICRKAFEYGMKAYKKREEEIKTFWDCVNEAKEKNGKEGTNEILEFEKEKKVMFAEMCMATDPLIIEQMIIKYQCRVTQLWDKLMTLEMDLLEQLEDVIKDLQNHMRDEVDAFIERFQEFTAVLRETERMHMEKLMDLANVTFERINRLESDINEDLLPEEFVDLFMDKDTVSNALSTTHDTHLLVIDDREDLAVKRIRTWFKDMFDTLHQEQEVARNRARVIEIATYMDKCHEEVDNLELKDRSLLDSITWERERYEKEE